MIQHFLRANVVLSMLSVMVPSEVGYAGTMMSSFNGMSIESVDSDESYNFLLAGHLYGAPENTLSRYPASSLLGNIDRLNSLNSAFFFSLGDNTRIPNVTQIAAFKSSFSDAINMPIFISPGNHDNPNSQSYKKQFGHSFFKFELKTEVFIVLNTESVNGNIVNEQFDFFRNALESAVKDPNINNIFIFSHKPIWAAQRPGYRVLMNNTNAPQQYDQSEFKSTVLPLLKKAASEKNIYWGSGDIGVYENAQLFFYRDIDDGVTYFATGLSDRPLDAIVHVKIDKKSNVNFDLISLMNEKLLSYDKYNLEFWNRNVEQEKYLKNEALRENFIGYYIGRAGVMIGHKQFSRGVLVGIIVLASIFGIVYVFRKYATNL